MSDKTKPVSIRLRKSEIDQLQARAYTLSASISGGRPRDHPHRARGRRQQIARRSIDVESSGGSPPLNNRARKRLTETQSIDQATRDLPRHCLKRC